MTLSNLLTAYPEAAQRMQKTRSARSTAQHATRGIALTGALRTAVLAAALLPALAPAATISVATDAELRTALTRNGAGSAGDGDTVVFSADITLGADLPVVQKSITIDGNGHTLSGADTYRGLFVANFNGGSTLTAVTVAIQNLTISHARAKGGSGGGPAGGGGAGLGGALFVADQADVTLGNVSLSANSALGGSFGGAGDPGAGAGGGGGMGGNGGLGGGGGLGIGANGGGTGSPGIATGAAPGASGGAPGGIDGGGGGGAGGGGVGVSGGGGGVGGVGHGGGFGGGGGYSLGGGGFGGGGSYSGGGFGGGGGGSNNNGGFGGGNGFFGSGGGGGAGMGGAIFVQQGGRLTLAGPLTINGGTVTGGTGNQNGSAFGSGLFLQGNGVTLAFAPAAADAQTISDVVTDQTGSGGTGANAGAGVLALTGTGSLTLTGANTYSGGTTISAGTLFANTAAPDSATGSGAVAVNGGTLAGNGNVAGDVALQSGAIAPGGSAGAVATLSTGALTWSGGAIDLQLGATPSASDAIVVAGTLSKAGSGPHVFHFSDGASPPVTCGTTYTLIQASSISGFAESDFSFDYSGSATGFAGRMAIAGSNVVLMGLCAQTIAFPAIPAQTYVSGGTFGVAATASSNLTVTFTSLTPSVCTVSGSTVTMLGTGTCTIAADQAGDATYAAASQMTQDVTINPGTQALLSASASPSSVVYGATSTLSTTGGSGTGAVTYAVTTGAAYCSVSGNVLTAIGIGTCTVTATKAGDTNYAPASATVDVTVGPKTTTITLAATPNPATPNTPVTITATLAGDPPTGTVTFCDGAATPDAACTGGTLLCTATLTPGSTSSTAACAHAFPTTGTHLLGAYYAGDGTYTAIATAQSLVLAVNAPAPPHAVPALSTWLLGLLGGLLATLGLARTRGRSPL